MDDASATRDRAMIATLGYEDFAFHYTGLKRRFLEDTIEVYGRLVQLIQKLPSLGHQAQARQQVCRPRDTRNCFALV